MLLRALDSFRCCKDSDIELFLRRKAIDFEKRGLCSVYLIVDGELFDKGTIFVHAYFTLSHKCIGFLPDISRTTRNRITASRNAKLSHFVLIGHLGKYINEEAGLKSQICSEEILNDAFEVIRQSSELIICRYTIVECIQNEKVQDVYTNYGFSYLQSDRNLCQFYKKIS